MTWESARDLDDVEPEARVFKHVGRNEPPARVPIAFEWVHRELRKTGVTLQTLWVDYQEGARLCNARALDEAQILPMLITRKDDTTGELRAHLEELIRVDEAFARALERFDGQHLPK